LREVTFTLPPPKIGKGKWKNEYALLNNVAKWYRYGKTRIKNEFKEQIKDWFLEKNQGEVFTEGEISFQILRNTKRRIDADAMSLAGKWVLDTFVERGYLIDDNKVKVIHEIPILGVTEQNETLIKVTMKMKRKVEK